MTNSEFWRIITATLEDCDDDLYQNQCLDKRLRSLSFDDIRGFEKCFSRYHDMTNKGEIWAAGMLLNGGHGSDDGFHYFRNWLISCGEVIFFQAMENPDSLAEIEVDTDEEGCPDTEFEEFSYVAHSVYEDVTGGESLYKDTCGVGDKEEVQWNWCDYDKESWLKENLPNLWRKYGRYKVEFERRVKELVDECLVSKVNIPNIGLVNKDGYIYHKSYGRGTVKSIQDHGEGFVCATIEFCDGVHSMILSAQEKLPKNLFSMSPFNQDKYG